MASHLPCFKENMTVTAEVKRQQHLTSAYKLYKSMSVDCSSGLAKTHIEKGNNLTHSEMDQSGP